jgi:hypothetical protein
MLLVGEGLWFDWRAAAQEITAQRTLLLHADGILAKHSCRFPPENLYPGRVDLDDSYAPCMHPTFPCPGDSIFLNPVRPISNQPQQVPNRAEANG